MTNYENYPAHRFCKGSCIICFRYGYSWCQLTNNQKKYLAKSDYLDGAERIDIKLWNGKVFLLTADQFRDWVNSGNPEPPEEEEPQINEDKVCPICGRKLAIRIARRGPRTGQKFWGCTGYPECKYTENL